MNTTQNAVTINLSDSIQSIMSKELVTVTPDTIMTVVEEIFETNNFHHLPVLNETGECVGVLSKSDFLQLQDQFTRLQLAKYEMKNKKFFKSLIVSDVMDDHPIAVYENCTLKEVVTMLLSNDFRSIMVKNSKEVCTGIITPYDILKLINRKN